MYGKAHGLSYLLDPRFIGYGLPQENRKELEDILVEVPADDTKSLDDTRRDNLYMQFTDFVISAEYERKSNSFRFKMLRDTRKMPLKYWQSDGVAWPLLQNIAIKLFAMATPSAASERNFSTFGFIHSTPNIAIKLFAMATPSAASERNFSTFGFIHSKLRN
jgi:hAT family C-terminal dimerisation region